MYIDASYPNTQGHKARLVSQDLQITSSPKCLKFWFHLYGRSIGRLNVYIKTGPGNKSESLIWTLGGNFGDQWVSAQAPVQSKKIYQVNLKSMFLSSFCNDFQTCEITRSCRPCITTSLFRIYLYIYRCLSVCHPILLIILHCPPPLPHVTRHYPIFYLLRLYLKQLSEAVSLVI